MFEPQLFGLLAKDYFGAAQTLFAPAVGFLFLYLLRLPLQKLPIIAAVTEYRPPIWLLPIFALGTWFLFVLFLSIGGWLEILRSNAPSEVFARSFQRTRQVAVKDDPGLGLKKVQVAVDAYDGRSDFRIFVNGYRIFGSSSNCMLKFQCQEEATRTPENRCKNLKKST